MGNHKYLLDSAASQAGDNGALCKYHQYDDES